MGLGTCSGVWGGRAVGGASDCARRPPLPCCPPSPRCLRFPRKTRRPGNRWGRSDRSTPSSPPPGAPPRPPNPPEGAVAARVAPLPPPPPTPAGGTIYNSAPIPRLRAGAGCLAMLIAAGISAPPRAGGDKFSFRKFGGTFSKTPRPREGESEALCSQPPSSQPPGGAGPQVPGTQLRVWGAALKLGEVGVQAKYGRVLRAGGQSVQRMAGRMGLGASGQPGGRKASAGSN